MSVTIIHADSRAALREMPDNSVDSVVTDPPYALNFMGKGWDTGDVAFDPAFWREVLRVLKPGGHIAAFGGSRAYHRMACAIEDAGFEIRDSLMWIYGTGFPKSLDVSKAIDKAAGAEREVIGKVRAGITPSGGLCRHSVTEAEKMRDVTAPATDAARQWSGFGTALKPAFEPIVLARKPLSEGTVAANVLRWGTGALNIDGCRVAHSETLTGGTGTVGKHEGWDRPWMHEAPRENYRSTSGRFPANVVHDGSDEVVGMFPRSRDGVAVQRNGGGQKIGGKGIYRGSNGLTREDAGYGGEGSAARFFYSAKASKADRAGSKHPTVKPISLMAWIARLITPPGGTVLDPFAGSGTTGAAALHEGFSCILIEREAEYAADIRRRFEQAKRPTGGDTLPLPF